MRWSTCEITDGSRDIMLFASQRQGRAFRRERRCARWAAPPTGVRGMRLPIRRGSVVSLIVVDGEGDDPHRHRTRLRQAHAELEEYPRKGRGTQGVIAIQCSASATARWSARCSWRSRRRADADLQPAARWCARARRRSRAASAATRRASRLIRLDEGDRLVGLERILAEGTEGGDGEEGGDAPE